MQTRFEVPQRSLSAYRFVDTPSLEPGLADRHQERGVRTRGHPPEDLDVATGEQCEPGLLVDVLRLGVPGGQFIRGHGWPSGSMGPEQNGQLGRPAATIVSACSQNAAI